MSNRRKMQINEEEEMRERARLAKQEREKLLLDNAEREANSSTAGGDDDSQDIAAKQRIILREVNRREKEKELRQLRSGKSALLKEQERDISERVALGQAQPTLTEAIHDQSLMNQ